MIKLKVPSADGGEEEGLNDPGVEFFLGDLERHLARETAQNAIDATATNPPAVTLSFEVTSLPISDVPCFDGLREVFKRCGEFWKSDRKSAGFFKSGLELLNRQSVRILRISDRNTTGLTGGDTDRAGRWYGLVRSAGVSNKGEGSGGSYGIGKFAPFAASQLRTVFYSTRTTNGEVAFQGITRLASHTDEDGHITRRTGYIGGTSAAGHACSAVRQINQIPTKFRIDQPGTDIFVVGYRAEDGWERHFISSILANFWPAIHRNLITFKVGDRVLNSAVLRTALGEFANDEDFDAHLYYKALIEGHRHEASIQNLGTVSLHLYSSDDDLPKRAALTRKTGMIISLKMFRSRRPFVGYLECIDGNGNELLRSLEPPRHDEWDPKRGTPAASKALRELYDWIRDCVRQLNPIPTDQALDVPDLARYLPVDEEADQEGPSQSGEAADEHLFTPVTPQRDLEVRPASEAKPRFTETSNEGGETESEGGSGNDFGGSGGGGGENESEGGLGHGDLGDSAGQQPSQSQVPKARLRLRSFQRNDGSYELVVRTDAGKASGFRLVAVGEDGKTQALPIKNVRNAATNAEVVLRGVQILAPVSARKPARIVVQFHTPIRLALAVEAL